MTALADAMAHGLIASAQRDYSDARARRSDAHNAFADALALARMHLDAADRMCGPARAGCEDESEQYVLNMLQRAIAAIEDARWQAARAVRDRP